MLNPLLSHQTSASHRAKIMGLLSLEVGPTGHPMAGAPSAAQFAEVWANVSGPCAVEGVGHGQKIRQMQHCLKEALMQHDRDFLKDKAEAITLLRDESMGRLLIRYIAASKNLERRCGILGVTKTIESAAEDITDRTADIIDKLSDPSGFSLPHVKRPLMPASVAQVEQRATAETIRQRIEAIVVDSAANETKSARLMAFPSPSGRPAIAPRLRCIVREKAHASRRFTSRPWRADKFLSELAEKSSWGGGPWCSA